MKFFVVSALALLFIFPFSQEALAGTAKVLKTRGRKAIIRVPKGMKLRRGDRVELIAEGDDFSEFGESDNGKYGRRRYRVDGALAFSSLSQEADSGGSTDFSTTALSALFGFNKVKYEFGGIFAISNVTLGSTEINQTNIGGFFEFNFSPNRPGVPIVGAAGGAVSVASQTSGGNGFSGFELAPYGTLKWFPLGNNVAGFGKVSYSYSTFSGDTEVTQTGLIFSGGFSIYF